VRYFFTVFRFSLALRVLAFAAVFDCLRSDFLAPCGAQSLGSRESTSAPEFREKLRNLIFVQVGHSATILIVGKLDTLAAR
jgi:hypothetical protein